MAYHSTIISEYILFQTFNWNKELKRITLPSSQKACYTFLGTIIEFNDLFSAFWVQYHIGLCTQTQRAALKDMKVRIIIIIINLSSFPFEKSISYFVWFSSVSSIDPFTFFFLLVIKNVSVIKFPGNLLNIERVTLLSRGGGGGREGFCAFWKLGADCFGVRSVGGRPETNLAEREFLETIEDISIN